MNEYLYINAKYKCNGSATVSIGQKNIELIDGQDFSTARMAILESGSLTLTDDSGALSLNDFSQEYTEGEFLEVMHEFDGIDFSYAVVSDAGVLHTRRLDYFKDASSQIAAFQNPKLIRVTRQGGALNKPIKVSLLRKAAASRNYDL